MCSNLFRLQPQWFATPPVAEWSEKDCGDESESFSMELQRMASEYCISCTLTLSLCGKIGMVRNRTQCHITTKQTERTLNRTLVNLKWKKTEPNWKRFFNFYCNYVYYTYLCIMYMYVHVHVRTCISLKIVAIDTKYLYSQFTLSYFTKYVSSILYSGLFECAVCCSLL